MKFQRKSFLISLFAISHLFLFALTYSYLNLTTIRAENVLTDLGTLANPGDQTSFNFTLPNNVEDVTISVYGDSGTDFDISNITSVANPAVVYSTSNREGSNET